MLEIIDSIRMMDIVNILITHFSELKSCYKCYDSPDKTSFKNPNIILLMINIL